MTSPAVTLPEEVGAWIASDLFEQAPLGISVLDAQLRIVTANRNFTAVFGEASGTTCYQAYRKRAVPCDNCPVLKSFADGRCRVSEADGVDCVGRNADLVVHHVPVRGHGGEVTYVVNLSQDITARRELQDEYNAVFEQVPCSLVVINKDFRIVRANRHARASHGALVGARCYAVYKQRRARCADCPAQRTFADGRPHQSREVRLASDGSATHHTMSTAALSPRTDRGERADRVGYVLEMSLDVTDVQLLSDRLLRESLLRERITESAIDAMIAADAAGRVTLYNAAAEALFKIPREQVIGRLTVERFFPDGFCCALRAGNGCGNEAGDDLLLEDTTVADAAGEEIPVRFSGTVLYQGDEVLGCAAFMQDLREVKRLTRQKLENERLAVVGQTVVQVAHSIKNILTGMQGGLYDVRAALSGEVPQRVARGTKTLERNLARIGDLVTTFLGFAREHQPQPTPVDPRALGEELVQLYRARAEQSGVALSLRVDAGVGPLRCDPRGLHTCLANLLANALDACQAQPSVAGDPHRVVLRVQQVDPAVDPGHAGDARVAFEVSDTGCGMDQPTRRKLFSNVFTTKGPKGVGLGLVMTKRIVDEHRGTISVHSTVGGGTTFRIELPAPAAPATAVEVPGAAAEDVPAADAVGDHGRERAARSEP